MTSSLINGRGDLAWVSGWREILVANVLRSLIKERFKV